MKRVEVEWVDSMMLNYGEWADRDDHERAVDHMTHRSCGYLFSENGRAIILAHTIYEGEAGDRAAGAMLIPRVAILSLKELPAPPNRVTEDEAARVVREVSERRDNGVHDDR